MHIYVEYKLPKYPELHLFPAAVWLKKHPIKANLVYRANT